MISKASGSVNTIPMVARGLLVLVFANVVLCQEEGLSGVDGTRYVNYKYGYSVLIPKQMRIAAPKPPAPQHGFKIKLSEHPSAVIWVEGSYNAALWHSLNEVLEGHLDYLKEEVGVELEVLARSPVDLSGLEAVRLALKYKKQGSGEIVREDFIVAMRHQKNVPVGVVYELGLTTSESRYQADKSTFNQLFSQWRLEPLP